MKNKLTVALSLFIAATSLTVATGKENEPPLTGQPAEHADWNGFKIYNFKLMDVGFRVVKPEVEEGRGDLSVDLFCATRSASVTKMRCKSVWRLAVCDVLLDG